MKHLNKVLRICMFAFLVGAVASSCKKDDDNKGVGTGTVTGTVTDEAGDPLSEVAVTITGVGATSTDAEGKYTLANVTKETHPMTFAKAGYQTANVTVSAASFNADNVAKVDIALVIATAKIRGTVYDARNGYVALAGVVVDLGSVDTETGEDGTYLLDGLSIDEYTVTFQYEGYPDIVMEVKPSDFVNAEVVLNVDMGTPELLTGLTVYDLEHANKWLYNQYNGGRNGDDYPRWDWSADYLCASDYFGRMEEQGEGTALRIRNHESDATSATTFDSYIYGSKKITADNKILSLMVRTHNDAPTHFGVKVIDLSVGGREAEAVTIRNDQALSRDYTDFSYDLSAYVGKEVVIAIGIYHAVQDEDNQLVLRSVRFAHEPVERWNRLPGTEVIAEGSRLTQGMVRSTMVQTKKSFTGISEITGGSNGTWDAYRAWRERSHIFLGWAFVPVHKDPEVFPSQGSLIKTRGNGPVDLDVPEAYIYAKFAIAAGSNLLSLRVRNFGGQYTFFKLTAIDEQTLNVTHVEPSNVLNLSDSDNGDVIGEEKAADSGNGLWQFKQPNGDGAGDGDSYATFEYDLSQFNGKNMVLVIGVYNGEESSDENKLCFYSINLN